METVQKVKSLITFATILESFVLNHHMGGCSFYHKVALDPRNLMNTDKKRIVSLSHRSTPTFKVLII